MQTMNNTDDENAMNPPEELTEFAKSKGWDGYEWIEATPYAFDSDKDQCRFAPVGGNEIVLTRIKDLPAWVHRHYYVGLLNSPVQPYRCFCVVHEADGTPTEYAPEKRSLPTTFDGDPKL